MWIDSLKKHINNEIAYSPETKAYLVGLIDSIPSNDPEAYLSQLINKINNAGINRSRELAKFLSRVLAEYRNYKQDDMSVEECLTMLDNIILGRR